MGLWFLAMQRRFDVNIPEKITLSVCSLLIFLFIIFSRIIQHHYLGKNIVDISFKHLRENVEFCDEKLNLVENSIQDGKLTYCFDFLISISEPGGTKRNLSLKFVILGEMNKIK